MIVVATGMIIFLKNQELHLQFLNWQERFQLKMIS